MKYLRPLLILALLSSAACSAGSGERGSVTVDRVRILAIQSEPASAQPGQEITLSALAVSPQRNDPERRIRKYTDDGR